MTNPPPVFTERQWLLRYWWPLLLVPALLGPLIAWLAPRHGSPPPYWVFILFGLVIALVAGLVLEVRLDAAGAHYRLLPLQWRWQHVAWPEVARAYLRRYDPLGEYGGWGIKGSSQNRAYNIANDEGLQIELRNGRRVLLGTQRPTELRQVLAALQAADATRPIAL
ncbi:MAG TPA: hypothetical protein VFO93_15695 [Hymenobacter sp.]|uniref:hypothetical protein n=1 Tax=Hymenobacter sp. TaxID=1898978 RepID=UPI002D7F10A7|nr:hypothetical protein [Hymenobacter sp.]HET9504986.1 hypothetical protein [Hymenobacter sp.]